MRQSYECTDCGDAFALSAALFFHKYERHSHRGDGKPVEIHPLLEELIRQETVCLSDESHDYTFEFVSNVHRIPRIKIEECPQNKLIEPEFIKLETNDWPKVSQSTTYEALPPQLVIKNEDDSMDLNWPQTEIPTAPVMSKHEEVDEAIQKQIQCISPTAIDDPLQDTDISNAHAEPILLKNKHLYRSNCPKCQKLVVTKNMKRHLQLVHKLQTKRKSKNDLYRQNCPKCHLAFVPKYLKKHLQLVHKLPIPNDPKADTDHHLLQKEDLYRRNCPNCRKSVVFKNMKRHLALVHKYDAAQATEAFEQAKAMRKLELHDQAQALRKVKLSTYVLCSLCSDFISAKYLNQHLRFAHDINDDIDLELLQATRKSSNQKGTIQCLMCGFEGTSKQSLLLHKAAIHSCMRQHIYVKAEIPESVVASVSQTSLNVPPQNTTTKEEIFKAFQYSCPICKLTEPVSQIRCHFEQIHQLSETEIFDLIKENLNMCEMLSIPCPLCALAFVSVDALEKHNINSHPFNLNAMRSTILVTQTDETTWGCSICALQFPARNPTINHVCTQHTDEIQRINVAADERFDCELCPFVTSIFPLYIHHQQQLHLGDVVEYKAKVKPSKHKVSLEHKRTKNRNFLCNICGHAVRTNQDLSNHMLTHQSDRPFTCEICNKGFKKRGTLREHMFVHTDTKRFICVAEGCDEKFSQRAGLQQHKIRKHLEVGRFKCQICDKKFGFMNKLKVHLRIHTGARPLKCCHCEKRFRTWEGKRRHERIHSGVRPHKCDPCNKSFSSRNHLRSHLATQRCLMMHQQIIQ